MGSPPKHGIQALFNVLQATANRVLFSADPLKRHFHREGGLKGGLRQLRLTVNAEVLKRLQVHRRTVHREIGQAQIGPDPRHKCRRRQRLSHRLQRVLHRCLVGDCSTPAMAVLMG